MGTDYVRLQLDCNKDISYRKTNIQATKTWNINNSSSRCLYNLDAKHCVDMANYQGTRKDIV